MEVVKKKGSGQTKVSSNDEKCEKKDEGAPVTNCVIRIGKYYRPCKPNTCSAV